jgi:hypothetical protein
MIFRNPLLLYSFFNPTEKTKKKIPQKKKATKKIVERKRKKKINERRKQIVFSLFFIANSQISKTRM